jgi:hypothetical protein
MGEGKDREQALGQCYGMWREHKGESAYADFAEALAGQPYGPDGRV